MPRLPTILVIGSQAISTRLPSSTVVIAVSPVPAVPGQEIGALLPPLGLLVRGLQREAAQRAYDAAVDHRSAGRHAAARRLVHERHELVREAGHRTGDADAADVGTTADAVDPAALGHVAFDHRSPAAELDQAVRRPVLARELALLVVA